jgi:RimJ/RimL family protein N-acetyltransferase
MNPLETQRTTLATVEEIHVATLAKLWTDPDVRKYLGGVVEPDAALEKVRSYIGLETHRTVLLKETAEIAGVVMLTPREGDMELSYLFFPEFWGLGYARESAAGLIQFGFEVLGLARIVAVTQSANSRSVRLLEALEMGFTRRFMEFGAEQSEHELEKL